MPLVALLVVAALIGGFAWALGWNAPKRVAPDGAAPDEAGAQRVEVPSLVGLPQDEARKRLENAGLELGTRDAAPSGSVADGAVMEQDPAARSKMDRGRAVNVVFSTGPPREPAPQISPSATATAPATAPADEAAAGEAAEEAAKEAQKRREEARKRAQERREEAVERTQERREEQEKRAKQ